MKLIIGCGYVGERVARRWVADGHRVSALTRGREEPLRSLGVEPIIGDVTDRKSLDQLPAAETVLYAVGMDRSAGKSMAEVYIDGLRNVLDALPTPGRLIYVSSTGVYGRDSDGEVDEAATPEPSDDSGRIVLQAEAEIPDAIRLRFAGIYGPGRLLRAEKLLTGGPIAGDPDKLINLIHVEDGVEAVLLADRSASPGSVFNVCDGHPVTRRAWYARIAELKGYPVPTFDGESSEGRDRGNRRISNRKLTAELGFRPRYPTYREGLAAIIAEA